MFEFAARRALSRSLLMLAVPPCVAASALHAQAAPHISSVDATRIREAFHLANALGDRVWPAWHDAPFALLLVTPDFEFLVDHPSPTPEFTRAGSDTLVGAPVFYRKRVFSTGMQATFPAVNGVNTVVIGQAELTGDKTSTRWVLTVLHEHFHQLVYSAPGYYADVAKLGLSHGDETGMWMLNYPFPYDSARVQEKFVSMTHALLDALAQVDERALGKKTAIFARAQREFRESVPAEAARYFDFQLWQEGVARYTELMLGELAGKHYVPLPAFSALPDFAPYGTVAAAIRSSVMKDLGSLSLAKARRIVVYSVGAAEALLLDRVRPEWQRNFFMHRFRLPDIR
jgi:hypothetical protein